MGKGKGSTDEYPFMQTPDLLSHFLHLGYTNSTLSPIWASTVRRNPQIHFILVMMFGFLEPVQDVADPVYLSIQSQVTSLDDELSLFAIRARVRMLSLIHWAVVG